MLLAILSVSGCRDFLDEKSDSKLATPETVADNQALLDQYAFSNTDFSGSGEVSSDDFFLSDAEFKALPYEEVKRLYTWQPDNVTIPVSAGNSWLHTYRGVYVANAVLHNLNTYNATGRDADNVRGQALALRAVRYLDAAQIWCKAYNKETARTDLGLPLRTDPDMNTSSVRTSLQETYDRILHDLHEASSLLPEKQVSVSRMSKPAVTALLGRTYLFMGDYDNALKYAIQSLVMNNKLMDYNTLNPSTDYPIKEFNAEVLFWAMTKYEQFLYGAKIPQNIYALYDTNDLRKQVFFNKNKAGEIVFKGDYNNVNGALAGIATDEVYLIAAESHARLGNKEQAMEMLNKLLITRWKAGTFVPFSAASAQEALGMILAERRKELLHRGLRWPDLKRLNRDGANIRLTRTVNGTTYELPPNDPRYAIAIPEDIIKLTGMQQNPR